MQTVDILVAKHVLQQHKMKVITGEDKEDRQRFHMCGRKLVQDSFGITNVK